ncbi:type II secretion system F family protein [Alkalihalobacillus macyae]|uniref:type II secretion system F family protein n=1 Tax=Guptibacillus hwajinpoensis TaxID=208199 RepID=UPI00273B50FA|nr:type II secretion system F family protein [Alkalihalobacillus macyae]MDP4552825.1 type II secretion system F family protein [Alkalihalobacillus macyae]
MIPFLFMICALLFFVLMFSAILNTIYRKEIAVEYRFEQYFGKKEENSSRKKKKTNLLSNPLVHKYWQIGVEQVNKTFAKKNQKKLDLLLHEAGYGNRSAVEFRLMQLLISITGGFLAFLLITPSSESNSSFALLLVLAIVFLFYRYPLFYLAKKKTKRIKQIDKEMSDFFDMVSLLLEAGVGLEGAISNVCSRKPGPLSEEFKQALDEMRRGKSRREAFHSLKQRVPSERFQGVMMSIIQADHLGIGMSKVIKNLTNRIREQRREAARELAMKAPVKMLIPMILFIFPPLFIVIIGPMVVKIIVDGLG